MEKKLYGYAMMTCLRDAKLPIYERPLHYQGEQGKTYPIECYNEAESDYYRRMSYTLKDKVFFGGLRTEIYDKYRNVVSAGLIIDHPEIDTTCPNMSGILHDKVDGLLFGEETVRNHYDCGTFGGE